MEHLGFNAGHRAQRIAPEGSALGDGQGAAASPAVNNSNLAGGEARGRSSVTYLCLFAEIKAVACACSKQPCRRSGCSLRLLWNAKQQLHSQGCSWAGDTEETRKISSRFSGRFPTFWSLSSPSSNTSNPGFAPLDPVSREAAQHGSSSVGTELQHIFANRKNQKR